METKIPAYSMVSSIAITGITTSMGLLSLENGVLILSKWKAEAFNEF